MLKKNIFNVNMLYLTLYIIFYNFRDLFCWPIVETLEVFNLDSRDFKFEQNTQLR